MEVFVNDLEDLANAPGDQAADIEAKHRQIEGAGDKATRLGTNPNIPGRGEMLGPAGNSAERKIQQAKALAARTSNESKRGRPKIATVVVRDDTTLFAVAANADQEFDDLLAINPTLDPLYIPAKTHVNIFSNTGATV